MTVPTGCTSVVLSFWLNVSTSETTRTTAYDKLTVAAGSTVLATYSNLTAAGYAQRSVTVSGAAGQSIVVTFKGVQNSSLQTSFFLDDTALTAS